MRIASPSSIEPRLRLSTSLNDETSKRRSSRNKVFGHIEKAFRVNDRNLSYKPTLKLVLVIIILGTFVTLFIAPSVYNTEHLSSTLSRPAFFERRISENGVSDLRYFSSLDINWDQISDSIEKLTDIDTFKGVGLLNFNVTEIDQWKVLIPNADHAILDLEPVSFNLTWESLYPEWIDEEEEFDLPTCPSLPKIHFPGKPRLDLIAAKLPCDHQPGKWSRDVARFHLQLETARLAASSRGIHSLRVVLVTDCFPIPNLFTSDDLVVREGDVWLYEPDLHKLRQKTQLPVGSCELSVPLKAKENFHSEKPQREAYATILHSAHVYVCGAIVAAQSIRMAGSTRDLVILVDESIGDHHRQGLSAAGWKIRTIDRIRNPKAKKDAYNEWNYSKFRLWQLTEYDKIIFIDADMLVLRNIDFLFEFPEVSATGNNGTLFNSGVMVVEPSNGTFQLLMDHVDEIESYNGGDQGYLNEIYTWWHRIPKHMNFLKHFWEGDEPEKKDAKTRLFGANPPALYVLHYLGTKPWICFRDYDCNYNVEVLREFASDVAHATWWKVHDAMPENLHQYCLLRSKQKAALEWDRREAEKANFTDGHWKIAIKDSRLETCFESFCFWESMLWHWGDANWTDNATTAVMTPPPVTISKASLPSL